MLFITYNRRAYDLASTDVPALIVLAALGIAVTPAWAGRFRMSERNIRAVWTPIRFQGATGAPTVACNVTLEGSYHYSTMAKVEGALSGLITRAIVARPCIGGTAWIYNGVERNEVLGNVTLANSLPWHLTYQGFQGTLPDADTILSVTGVRLLYRATVFGITLLCNYTTGAANGISSGIAITDETGRITGVSSDENLLIRSESGGCPSAHFANTASLTVLGSSTAITVTLI